MAVTLCVALVAGLSVSAMPARTAAASTLYTVPGNSIQIPAGGSAYLQVRGVALQPGAVLPAGALTLAAEQPLPGDKVRTSIFYGIDWGYSDTAPYQVALAVWWAQNGTWLAEDHVVAERIATAASNTQGIPSWNPDGRNLLTLISQNQAALAELTLTPLEQTASVGNGTLSVRNTSINDMVVYLPYGTLFTGASGSALVWATGVGNGQSQASPTAVAAQPTATTAAPTEIPATSTPLPAQLTATATVVRKGGGTQPPPAPPANSPTAQPQAKGATATPVVVPPTDTPVPPTNTPAPTDTPLPTSTPVPPTPAPPAQPTEAKQQSGTNSNNENNANNANNAQPAPQSPQLTPSAPEKPVSQKGQAPIAPATTASSNSNTQNEAGGAAAKPEASTGNAASTAPAEGVQGPPLPVSTPDATRSTSATATPTTGGGTGNSDSGKSAAPAPVSTVLSEKSSAPSPVSTGEPKATIPFPAGTIFPTVEVAQPTKQPEKVEPTTAPAQPTIATSPNLGGANDGTGATDGAKNGVDKQPAPEPTPAPIPQPEPTKQITNAEPPVIVVGPNSTGDGTAQNPSGAGNSSTDGSVPTGPQPSQNPITGGGPSSMPFWLSGAALLMLLGGWALRRVAHTTQQ